MVTVWASEEGCFGPRSNRARKRLKIQAIMTYIRKLDKITLNLYTRDYCRSCRASAQGSLPGMPGRRV